MMKRILLHLAALLMGAAATVNAHTPDVATREIMTSGKDPRPISAPTQTEAGADKKIAKCVNRESPALTPLQQATFTPLDGTLKKPAGGWNIVPETASATLGLIATLILLLRRRAEIKSMTSGEP